MQSFGWIRNPLSIIAIFISLIYAIASLLFGLSVKNLSHENQTVLVWFVVIFPLIVLAVFTWLVAKHHHKLYGPGDYRNDEPFTRTFPTATPSEIEKKHEAEVKQIEGDTKQAAPKALSFKGRGVNFVLETLVLQELQSSLGGSFRRDVRVADRTIVDCVIETSTSITFVEVKILTVNWYLFTALQAAGRTLQSARMQSLHQGAAKPVITMILLVTDDDIPEEELEMQKNRLPMEERTDFIRQFKKADLLKKYEHQVEI